MCLPWSHKWETIDSFKRKNYQQGDRRGVDLPIDIFKVITQRCTHCGKEIVRKYRV